MKYIMAISGILWSVGLFAQDKVPVGVWKTDRDELIIIHDTSYAMAGGIIEMNGWMSRFDVTTTNDSVLFDSKNQSYHFLVENQTDSTLILNPISRQSRNAFQRRERIEFRRSTLWNRSKFQFLVYTDSCTAYHGPCSINQVQVNDAGEVRIYKSTGRHGAEAPQYYEGKLSSHDLNRLVYLIETTGFDRYELSVIHKSRRLDPSISGGRWFYQIGTSTDTLSITTQKHTKPLNELGFFISLLLYDYEFTSAEPFPVY